ncbi:lactonase family protein [Granulicella arctica]|uniref:lactonase family protein n=1 Tax=Granulicella arctica TaxID=940613 RepID=UPI0021DF56B6|nr:lactonase family protein [Granulicella arctica]
MTLISRRSALSLLAASPAALRAFAKAPAAPVARLYVGTYTEPVGASPGAKGIYTCSWDAATGILGAFEVVATTPNPTFLAVSPKQPGHLYAVNELGNNQIGTVSTFTAKPGTTQLTPLNVVSSAGKGPCHLAIDHTGRALFVANYGGGIVSSFKITPQGLSEAVSVFPFSGHGSDPDRQSAPHTHCVLLSPDNRYLLVNDLGLDRIMVYHVDPATAVLTPAAKPYYEATPGSGPRHATFHPQGRWLYSTNELNSTVDLIDWNPADGTLTHKATVSSLPPSAIGQKNAPAEIAIDPTGKFLYVSNRFHDSIGVFAIDPKAGTLSPVQDMNCGGKTPRHFTLDPTGRWVIVANQDSRNIVVFERNHSTGELTATGRSYDLNAPVCIVFA